jgi:hypothetical protein
MRLRTSSKNGWERPSKTRNTYDVRRRCRVYLYPANLRLAVSSILGQFVRIGTQPCIDVHREVREPQATLLQEGERDQMTTYVTPFSDDGQRQLLKSFQKVLGRGVGRGPLRVPCIWPRQLGPFCCQVLAHDKLQQRQHRQPNQQQADQVRGMVIRFQINRRQRQGEALT